VLKTPRNVRFCIKFSNSAVKQFSSSTVQQFSSSTVQQFSSSTVHQFSSPSVPVYSYMLHIITSTFNTSAATHSLTN